MNLDKFLPVFQFSEIHRIAIRATDAEIFYAIENLKLSEISPVVNWLFALRQLPSKLTGKPTLTNDNNQILLDSMKSMGFFPLATGNKEIVMGFIGQFWKPKSGKIVQISAPEYFISPSPPDYAKAAMNFIVSKNNKSRETLLTTETRINVPDKKNRRKFRIYWSVIYLGSALIRRLWLHAIKKKAEK